MLLVLLAFLTSTPALAGGCSSSGCGGNFSATEFKDLAADAISDLRAASKGSALSVVVRQTEGDSPKTVTLSVDPAVLEASFKSVSVVNDTLFLDGRIVDFKSDPKSAHVDFNGKDWEVHSTREERMRMVVHELLMLSTSRQADLDDYRYNEQLSRKLTTLAIGAEAKAGSVAAGKPFCQLISHKPRKFLDPHSFETHVYGTSAAKAEDAKAAVIASCKQGWGKDAAVCDQADLRCDVAGKTKIRARLNVQVPIGLSAERSFSGYGNSEIEAEYQARKSCLVAWPDYSVMCGASEKFGQSVSLENDLPAGAAGADANGSPGDDFSHTAR